MIPSKTIDQLPLLTDPISAATEVPIWHDGVTFKITMEMASDYIASSESVSSVYSTIDSLETSASVLSTEITAVQYNLETSASVLSNTITAMDRSLNGLIDVTITDPVIGAMLTYNGTEWVDEPPGFTFNLSADTLNVSDHIETNSLTALSSNINQLETDKINFDVLYSNPSPVPGDVWWNQLKGCLNVSSNISGLDSSILEVGQEMYLKVYNPLPYQINPGQVVHLQKTKIISPDGVTPLVGLSRGDSEDTALVQGLSTNIIPVNGYGYITVYGFVHDLDTSQWEVDDRLYLSQSVSGGLTNVEPSGNTLQWYSVLVAKVMVSHSTSGILFCNPKTYIATDIELGNSNTFPPSQNAAKVYSDTKVPLSTINDAKELTGWVDNSNITVTYNYASTGGYITLQNPNDLIYVWRGNEVNLGTSWNSTRHQGVTGKHYLYMNEPGSGFSWSQTPWTFDSVMIALVNFSSTSVSASWCLREVHGMMNGVTHEECHHNIGTWKKSGGTVVAGSYALNTPGDTNIRPSWNPSVIVDEDLETIINAPTSANYTLYYVNDNASGTFIQDSLFPFIPATVNPSATPFMYNDILTGTMVAGAGNRWYNFYQILIPVGSSAISQKYRAIYLQPQVIYTSLANAQAESLTSLGLGGLPALLPEFFIATRLTYNPNAPNGTTTGKALLIDITYITGNRSNQVAITGYSTANHANLSSLGWLTSGHTGLNGTVAGFGPVGEATNYTVSTSAGTLMTVPATATPGYVLTTTPSGTWAASALPTGITAQSLANVISNTSIAKTYSTLASADRFAVTDSTSGGALNYITWNELKKLQGSGSPQTIIDDNISGATAYIGMQRLTSGSASSTYVSSTKLTFVPSAGVLSATEFNTTSDIKLKENITSLMNSLDVIGKLNPVQFNWKENGNLSFGLIAQELEQTLPTLIREINGTKTVSYLQLIAFLIGAVKEQQLMIDDIKNRL